MASPPENQIADDRDVQIDGNGCFAMRAGRSRPDNGQISGYSVDTDIEKATNAGPEHESNKCDWVQ